MSGKFNILYSSAAGYALFKVKKYEEIGSNLSSVRAATHNLGKFSKMIELIGFSPFISYEEALENQKDIVDGNMSKNLKTFLETELNIESTGKKSKSNKKIKLGVEEQKLAKTINVTFGISVEYAGITPILIKGIREHFTHFVKVLDEVDLRQSQLSLAFAYSRSRIKFDVSKIDTMIIHAINLIDVFTKDLNTYFMRVREWYFGHFPELIDIVKDPYLYCKTIKMIQHKENISSDNLDELEELLDDKELAEQVIKNALNSIGSQIDDVDMQQIQVFVDKVISLYEYLFSIKEYLTNKMNTCAPNLRALIGDAVGAKLIAKAGSLVKLAKYPASTIQILGAEKALFRALKSKKKNTPKYGALYNCKFIAKANSKDKGRMARFVANKCGLAARIDMWHPQATSIFGSNFAEQCEERLEFYKSGKAPRKNLDVMKKATKELAEGGNKMEEEEKSSDEDKPKKKKKSKRKAEMSVEELEEESTKKKKKKKAKKEKKDKKKKKKKKKKKNESSD